MSKFVRPTCTIHYDDVGRGGPPLVFLHGWCDDAYSWESTVAEFSKTHRCIVPEMRGHGRSSMPRDHAYFPEALSGDVVALCESIGAEKPVLVGHSFGGFLAAEIVRRFPDFARAAVIEDQPLDLLGFHAQMSTVEEAIRSAETHLAFREQLERSLMTPAMPAEVGNELVAHAARTPVEVGQALWAALFEYTADELRERGNADMAAQATLPVQLIDGQEPPGYYAELRAVAPGVRIAVLDCGHWTHLERPGGFRKTLREFLSALS
jgi:pimeloyl-ACP methyl ester carboxylesterase